ncbi:MAG: hypothetical protein P4L51_29315 [Puia sp.]|nr:hypothetical protein [Puia sp.]
MQLRMIFALVPILSALFVEGRGLRQVFDKQAFYKVMETGDLGQINDELTKIGSASLPEKEAYEGALLMRKAGLTGNPADKLKFFKAGRIKLESSLIKDSSNGEYHFLRLTIQEHAPGIVRYHAELKKDSRYLHDTFKSLSPVVRQAIIDYSKNSKILRPEDF